MKESKTIFWTILAGVLTSVLSAILIKKFVKTDVS